MEISGCHFIHSSLGRLSDTFTASLLSGPTMEAQGAALPLSMCSKGVNGDCNNWLEYSIRLSLRDPCPRHKRHGVWGVGGKFSRRRIIENVREGEENGTRRTRASCRASLSMCRGIMGSRTQGQLGVSGGRGGGIRRREQGC